MIGDAPDAAHWSTSSACPHDAQGDFIVMTIMNLNKQGRLFSQDYRPWCWSQSMAEWQPMT